ncbi:MAG: hypothetical protein ABRQ27_08015 [Clostridiaceae bacterium]
MFLAELKRSICNKKFLFIIIFGILILFLGAFSNLKDYIFFNYNASDLNTPKLQHGAHEIVRIGFNKYSVWFDMLKYYTITVPILAALPFSTSFVDDKKYNLIQCINSRVNHKKYIFAKILSNGIAGGISVALPVLIGSIVVNLFFSGSIDEFYAKGAYGGIFSSIVISNFNLYILIHCLILFIFGFAYSNLALAVSTKSSKKFAILTSPFLFFLISTVIGQVLNIKLLRGSRTIQFYLNPTVSMSEILIQFILLLVVFSVIFLNFSKKEYIYE